MPVAAVAVKKKKGNAAAMVAAKTKSDFKRAPSALFLFLKHVPPL
jgi:hypothetical protein